MKRIIYVVVARFRDEEGTYEEVLECFLHPEPAKKRCSKFRTEMDEIGNRPMPPEPSTPHNYRSPSPEWMEYFRFQSEYSRASDFDDCVVSTTTINTAKS
jgi:hypothetical protein